MTSPIPQDEPKIPGRPVKYNPTLSQRIDDVILRYFGAESVTAQTRFVEDLGADSLDVTELACELEEQFEIGEIPDELIDKFIFVQDLHRYIEKRVKA